MKKKKILNYIGMGFTLWGVIVFIAGVKTGMYTDGLLAMILGELISVKKEN